MIKNTYISFLAYSIIAILLIASCGPKGIIDNPESVYPLILGDKVNLEVNGIVTDEFGNPVEDASVSIANNHTTTDENGIFSFERISVYENYTKIKIAKIGFRQLIYSLSVIKDGSYTIPLTLNTKQKAKVIAANTETVSINEDFSISLPSQCFTLSNSVYTSDINLYSNVIGGDEINKMIQLPGNFQGLDERNRFSGLELVSAFQLSWESDNGVPLNLSNDHKIPFKSEVNSELLKNVGNTISLWHFDPLRALWIEKGIADISGSSVEGNVTTSGWWMLAHKNNEPIVVSYTAIDQSSNPIENLVTYFEIDGRICGRQYADNKGESAGYIPRDKMTTAIVYDICGNLVDQFTVEKLVKGKNLGEKELSLSSNDVISGTLIDCDGNPISHGLIKAGNRLYNVSDDGTFKFHNLDCSSTSEIVGINLKNNYTTDIIDVVSTGMNVGYIQLQCDPVSIMEHITIDIDGKTITHDENVKISPIGDSWEITGYGQDGNAIFSIKDIELGPQEILAPSAQSSHFFNLDGTGNVVGLIGKNEAFITRTGKNQGDFILGKFSGIFKKEGGEEHNYKGNFAVMR